MDDDALKDDEELDPALLGDDALLDDELEIPEEDDDLLDDDELDPENLGKLGFGIEEEEEY
jgi:hypothetical protein